MLVLTRRLKQKIVFPSIPAEIQVLGIRGDQVRLGIEAAPQIAVLREELAGQPGSENDSGAFCSGAFWSENPESSREFIHQLRNRLNDLGLNLAILRQRVHQGQTENADLIINRIEEELRRLRQELEEEFSRIGAEHPEEVPPSEVGTVPRNIDESRSPSLPAHRRALR
jgi:carbon storage regulator CsrA